MSLTDLISHFLWEILTTELTLIFHKSQSMKTTIFNYSCMINCYKRKSSSRMTSTKEWSTSPRATNLNQRKINSTQGKKKDNQLGQIEFFLKVIHRIPNCLWNHTIAVRLFLGQITDLCMRNFKSQLRIIQIKTTEMIPSTPEIITVIFRSSEMIMGIG